MVVLSAVVMDCQWDNAWDAYCSRSEFRCQLALVVKQKQYICKINLGLGVGLSVGFGIGLKVGFSVGLGVGLKVGFGVGTKHRDCHGL